MSEPIRLRRLEVEGQAQPLAVDVPRPRFTWVLDAGRRDVDTLRSRVTVQGPDGALVWDSGDRPAREMSAAPDADLPLTSLVDLEWAVRVSPTSAGDDAAIAASRFGTGLLDDRAWAGSRWVAGAGGPDAAAPLLRRAFDAPAGITRARLAFAAGGYAALTLNGRPVSDEVLAPGLADFDRRVPYVVHDVTALLTPGRNVLAASLGRGFYGMTTENTWNWHRAPWHAEPCLRAMLLIEHDSGAATVVTDERWTTSRGGTRADSLYEGEVFDARLEPSGWRDPSFDEDWAAAIVADGPRGALRARPYPGIRVTESLAPVSVQELPDGRFVADFGRQVAGWVRLRTPAETAAGTVITLTHAERLREEPRERRGEPEISTPFSAGELQVDRFTSAGGASAWEPSFGYKGFQWVGVEGLTARPADEDLTARVAHTDLARRARFRSSNELLTWMHEASVATIRNNLHHIPTDTPVFEKNGWTGDARLGVDMMLRDLDTTAFLEDWCRTLSDSRDADGRPALIAPSPGWVWPDHMQSPPWHSAYVMIPWRLYEATGDDRVLREHAEGIFRYVRLEHACAVDGLSDTGLGDYLSPDRSGNPDEDLRVCATAAVYESTLAAAAVAALIGDAQVEREMRAQADVIRAAFLREFFDDERGVVRDRIAGYRQAHNVLALDAGLIPAEHEARVAAALADDVDVHRDGHLWVGALGVRRVLPVLDRHGHGATAFRAATAEDFPSWGHWRAQGATTMWEYWDDTRSRNHYFFGTVDDWLFSSIAGLSPAAPGYRDILVEPKHLERLEWAEAEVDTVRGTVAVSWTREGDRGRLRVDVPTGSMATVAVPGVRRRIGSGRTEVVFDLRDRGAA